MTDQASRPRAEREMCRWYLQRLLLEASKREAVDMSGLQFNSKKLDSVVTTSLQEESFQMSLSFVVECIQAGGLADETGPAACKLVDECLLEIYGAMHALRSA